MSEPISLIDTNFYIDYDIVDVTAAVDATVTSNTNKSFADISLLQNGSRYLDFGTMEHNFFILDESLAEKPADDTTIKIGEFSNSMSDANGEFSTVPIITVVFTELHSSPGLTIVFEDDFPDECEISWYNLSNLLLGTDTFKIKSKNQRIEFPVENYSKIIFRFTKTKIPYRYIKINKIVYGYVEKFTESRLVDGTIVETSDLLSNQLAINKLNFSIVDLDAQFNFGNPLGLHSYIQPKQQLHPYEYVNGKIVYLGKYFVESFSVEEMLVKFNCVSYVDLMDKVTYYKGDIYNGILAGVLIDDIMNTCGITDYRVDSETYNTPLYGSLSPQTCRQAMREVLFACQSMLDTSRSDDINIYKRDNIAEGVIGLDRKISTKITRKDYVSGVEIKYNTYTLNATTSEISKDIYTPGEHLITFASPYIEVTASVGTILESGKYYVILDVPSNFPQTEITLTGKGYEIKTLSEIYKVPHLKPGTIENITTFTTTLSNRRMARNLARYALAYLQYRLSFDIQFIMEEENVKDWVILLNPDKRYNNYGAGFEQLTIDLVNGFIGTGKLVGYYSAADYMYYAKREREYDLYSGNDFII